MSKLCAVLLASAIMAAHPGMGVWVSIDQADSPIVTRITAGDHMDFEVRCADGMRPILIENSPAGYVEIKCGVPIS
jgi:hypothetical protein